MGVLAHPACRTTNCGTRAPIGWARGQIDCWVRPAGRAGRPSLPEKPNAKKNSALKPQSLGSWTLFGVWTFGVWDFARHRARLAIKPRALDVGRGWDLRHPVFVVMQLPGED